MFRSGSIIRKLSILIGGVFPVGLSFLSKNHGVFRNLNHCQRRREQKENCKVLDNREQKFLKNCKILVEIWFARSKEILDIHNDVQNPLKNTLVIAVKNYAKCDIKIFSTCPVLLYSLTLFYVRNCRMPI